MKFGSWCLTAMQRFQNALYMDTLSYLPIISYNRMDHFIGATNKIKESPWSPHNSRGERMGGGPESLWRGD